MARPPPGSDGEPGPPGGRTVAARGPGLGDAASGALGLDAGVGVGLGVGTGLVGVGPGSDVGGGDEGGPLVGSGVGAGEDAGFGVGSGQIGRAHV